MSIFTSLKTYVTDNSAAVWSTTVIVNTGLTIVFIGLLMSVYHRVSVVKETVASTETRYTAKVEEIVSAAKDDRADDLKTVIQLDDRMMALQELTSRVLEGIVAEKATTVKLITNLEERMNRTIDTDKKIAELPSIFGEMMGAIPKNAEGAVPSHINTTVATKPGAVVGDKASDKGSGAKEQPVIAKEAPKEPAVKKQGFFRKLLPW